MRKINCICEYPCNTNLCPKVRNPENFNQNMCHTNSCDVINKYANILQKGHQFCYICGRNLLHKPHVPLSGKIKYKLTWYNYIAQETFVDILLANNEDDAKGLAILYIKSRVGHDDSFAENSIESLYEYSEPTCITWGSVIHNINK